MPLFARRPTLDEALEKVRAELRAGTLSPDVFEDSAPARPAAGLRRADAVDVGGFLYTGGWATPSALTLSRFAERFEQVYGHHDGSRRDHAKGLSATGTFASNGHPALLERAPAP